MKWSYDLPLLQVVVKPNQETLTKTIINQNAAALSQRIIDRPRTT